MRRTLIVLLSALFLLIVAFGVFMGAASLAAAMQDPPGALVLMWIARSCLMLIVIDVVLLVSALGIQAVAGSEIEGRSDDA